MPVTSAVYAESFSFAPTTLISLFEIDSRFISAQGQIFRFHSGVAGSYHSIVFASKEYTAFPIDVTGIETSGAGGIPRPKLKASNIQGFISQFLLTQGSLVGARFIRRRVFARWLDDSNWPGGNPYGTPNPSAAYDDEIWYVNRVVTENPEAVELETISPFELDNVQLPNRQILATICSAKYRDPETCGYVGDPLTDRFGRSFTDGPPDGYGFTLNSQGAWSSSTTYQPGDWVTVLSENDFTYGETFVYVCSIPNTVGASNNPQFNPYNWVQDACTHNVLGCKTHFPTGPLPFLGYPGCARAAYTNN